MFYTMKEMTSGARPSATARRELGRGVGLCAARAADSEESKWASAQIRSSLPFFLNKAFSDLKPLIQI